MFQWCVQGWPWVGSSARHTVVCDKTYRRSNRTDLSSDRYRSNHHANSQSRDKCPGGQKYHDAVVWSLLTEAVQVSDPKDFVLTLSKAEQNSLPLLDLRLHLISQSQLSAEILNKPEGYISIAYRHNEFLSFSGTFEPAFQLTLVRLGWGALNEEDSHIASR